MLLEKQVCSLQLSKRLRELGVKQESLFCYQAIKNSKHEIWPRKFNLNEFFEPSEDERMAAFTVGELGELLPKRIFITADNSKYPVTDNASLLLSYDQAIYPLYSDIFGLCKAIHPQYEDNETEANARAKMIIYLIENGLIEVRKINHERTLYGKMQNS